MYTFFKYYGFTLGIIIAAVIAYMFPQYFIQIGSSKSTFLIIPLLQIIMFGVGTTMTSSDFVEVFKFPRKVIVGLICQFSIMPLLGYFLSKLFSFPPEIAAGIILVGCSPSGLASNVMAMIAKANVALSVTITSCATLLSPIITPLLMKLLVQEYVAIDTFNMVFDIIKMVIVPIVVGIIVNKFFKNIAQKLNSILPLLSMVGIGLIIMVITANGKEALASVGFLLIIAVLIHNIFGYVLGYYLAKISGMNIADSRTVAIEVGLQNAGLASGLAVQMGKTATVGLAAALFGPIMNTTGSIIAVYWGKKS